jgi:cell division protein FtsX
LASWHFPRCIPEYVQELLHRHLAQPNQAQDVFCDQYHRACHALTLLVLLIACINFMNLSTARSAERGKEVGIRKSIGALRSQLGVQFLGETVLFSLIALIISLGLVSLVL